MNVVISLLSSTLDTHGHRAARWHFWRPSFSLAMYDDIQFNQCFIDQCSFQSLLDRLTGKPLVRQILRAVVLISRKEACILCSGSIFNPAFGYMERWLYD